MWQRNALYAFLHALFLHLIHVVHVSAIAAFTYTSAGKGLNRFDIVNGVRDEAEAEKEADKDAHVEKCVPEFWLTAMKKNKVLAKEITEKDEVPLKHLKDIKWSRTGTAKGFKLSFYFDDDNPYFHNAVLTKIYRMKKAHHMFDELILKKIQATKIEWKYGKNFTWKQVGKKLKHRSNIWVSEDWTMNIRINKSFFNLFNALVPGDDNDFEFNSAIVSDDDNDFEFNGALVPDDDNDFEETVQELQNEIDQDYLVGCTIRDQIIPHAVSWFAREASQV
ncbi:nucleosome assembly protein 1;2-like [Papaver somniferum]|uniref:nucleosome assembly protein 1;2-like n=1 Tax=Papaver somniferum TaxID=3469 RepID=UPI000E700A6F|nr:nucleosome assembly protein 1;2-like [Papaver somniferum]